MRVAMYYSNSDVRLKDLPVPKIGKDELLVKVKACGICGSDVMEWYRIKKAPIVLGHEACGVVAQTKEEAGNFKIGDRVFVSHHVPCNTCRYCLNGDHTVCQTLHTTNFYPGGFAEYIQVPKINVERGTFILPPEVSFEDGTFIEPLACVIRAQRMVNLKSSQQVLILGCGISGLLHLLLALAKKVERVIVTDINEYKLKAAKDFGADIVINAKEDVSGCLREANMGRLADIVIVCTQSTQAFHQALQCVEKAGTILCFAPTEPGVSLEVPVNEFWRNSIKIMHSYGASPDDLIEAIEILKQGLLPVNKMITHRLGLNQAGLGFKLASEAKDAIKVIIKPEEE